MADAAHRAWLGCWLVAGLLVTIAPVRAVAAPSIDWRVENPFRLFLDPKHTDVHRAELGRMALDERLRPVLGVERRLAERNPHGWAEATVKSTCWSEARQRYECPASAYVNPTSHRVVVRLVNNANPDATCRWISTSLAATPMQRAERSIASCGQAMTIEVPYATGAHVEVSADGRRLASADIRVRDILIVGIGDSFAAGDGNPDIPVRFNDRRGMAYKGDARHRLSGFPARVGGWSAIRDPEFTRNGPVWLSAPCHRSLYGHQLRAALQLAVEDPHRAVTFASFACWGSEIVNGLLLPQTPTSLVPELPRASQLSAVAQLQCGEASVDSREWSNAFDASGKLPQLNGYQALQCPKRIARPIDLLLITAGGNDVGFAQLVANAILSDDTPMRRLGGLLGQVISAPEALHSVQSVAARLRMLNRAIRLILHVPWNESDRIVLTSYPSLALHGADAKTCPSSRQGMTLAPGFALDQQRARESELVGQALHGAMQRSAKENGWTFVDAHRRDFEGRGLCAGTIGSLASPADDVRLPRLVDGAWRPYPPSQWQPYAPRQRWIRTPNDGFLTVNFHVGRIDAAPINLVLAGTYSGAFHPTAEGQAAIADAVVDKGRAVLERYARQRHR